MVKAKKIKSTAKEDAPKIADNNNTSKQKTAVKKGNSKKAVKKIRKKPLKTVKSGGASSGPKSKKVELTPAKTLPSPKRKQKSQAKAETEQETSSVNGTCEAIYETHQGIQTESDSDQIIDSADMKGNGCLKIITWNVAGLRALVKVSFIFSDPF
ncbi:unnamed protein product [Anisakis simplex]|uniref:Endo/exonuclease/phosphatase domain-containing protein n=1 Tax=Anisakis simplex TaxID=6269 RepID=A0A0M3J708_ANISI|nr:unnamed protein product [Anisakis simplex]